MTDIDLGDIRDFILTTVREMFDKVFGIPVVVSDTEMLEIMDGEHLAASVNCTGDILGSLVFTMNGGFANLLAGSTSETEKDGIRALYVGCDHICRRLDDHLKGLGFACDLSSPFVVVGRDFRTAPLSMEKSEVFSFQHKEQTVLVELGLKMLGQRESGPKEKPAKAPDANGETDIRAYVQNAVPTMFERMFSIKNVAPVEVLDSADGQIMAGSVCLAGTLTGCVHLFVGEDLARLMTMAMLDITPDEIENIHEIHTVIGQACMIITRNLKRHLNHIGHAPELSNPLITSGTDFSMDHTRMTRQETLTFEQDGNPIWVRVGLNLPGDRVAAKEAPDDAQKTDGSAADDAAPEKPRASDLLEGETDFILGIPLDVSVELGRTQKKIRELLEVSEGSVVVLSELENDPVDILVNGVTVARGEVVVENGKYGVRVTEVKSRGMKRKTTDDSGSMK